MRGRLIPLALAVALGAACGPSTDLGDDDAHDGTYLGDRSVRRDALVRSLVNPENAYSKLRLARYATGAGDDWDRLPAWNPRVTLVRPEELDAPGGARIDAPLDDNAVGLDATRSPETFGARAFWRYPVQIVPAVGVALASREAARRYGLWIGAANVGGLVRIEGPDGSPVIATTCATCHATSEDTPAPNTSLDYGAMLADTSPLSPDAPRERAWGPGRIDVTTPHGTEPVRIPDLRPVPFFVNLHQAATLRLEGVTPLAIRIETLLITSQEQARRPPRTVALALANYIWSLGDTLPTRPPSSDEELRGRDAFATACASCHAAPSFTGPPVPVEAVGTDGTIARSSDRGTGMYAVPSLRGVALRGPLMHDASIRDLPSLLDPSAPGRAALGHTFGLDLDAPTRAAILAYLRTL